MLIDRPGGGFRLGLPAWAVFICFTMCFRSFWMLCGLCGCCVGVAPAMVSCCFWPLLGVCSGLMCVYIYGFSGCLSCPGFSRFSRFVIVLCRPL